MLGPLSECISTHDLTKRSTIMQPATNCQSIYFNSRPHEEVDFVAIFAILFTSLFQLTTSRRGRRYLATCNGNIIAFQLTTSRRGRLPQMMLRCESLRYFNSRPHEEVDDYLAAGSQTKRISTHDLTKRSTRFLQCGFNCVYISTHDLTKRSTSI